MRSHVLTILSMLVGILLLRVVLFSNYNRLMRVAFCVNLLQISGIFVCNAHSFAIFGGRAVTS